MVAATSFPSDGRLVGLSMCDAAAHVHPSPSCCQVREGMLRAGRTHCSTPPRPRAPAHARVIAPHEAAQTSNLVRSNAQLSAGMRMNAQLSDCVRMNAHSSSSTPRSEDLRAATYSIAAMLRFAATSQSDSAALCCTTYLSRRNSEFRAHRDLAIPMRARRSGISLTRITEP